MGGVSMGTLVKAAVFPTLEVVLMCSVGAVLSWTGKVNAEQRKFLSNLVMFLFVPCIIFEKLGSSISMENLVTVVTSAKARENRPRGARRGE
mmetsp:Transcript_58156/g.185088  ORF Transcript_58156/g.185088 Transcript_58156/m.185088 type:complete len:92 (-) Transcript_58156:792-1067(-)